MHGTVFVGGGFAGRDNNYIVMEYDTCSGKWDMLPQYKLCNFSMTVIDNQLVLYSGWCGWTGKKMQVVGCMEY